ncbi:gastrotropin isoform X2 [Vidua macroura]|uniref:gastrotropin isoform X2 n=1 Tax=Vidua macroura TaxID=187451 RepID=UPI0023A7B289|nr:gastrotropin isoform X2 [Vidua macroura]
MVRKWSLKVLPGLSPNLTGFCLLLQPVQLQVLVAVTLHLRGSLHSEKRGIIPGARTDGEAKLSCGCCSAAQAHPKGTMAFSGKYEFEGDENYDAFVQKIGLPSDKVEMGRNCKIVTEVVQNGNDFTWTQHFPGGRTTTNTFTVGKEADMETMGGKKFKATVKMEDGKLVADFPNYRHTAEICGGKLVEISTSSGVVYKRTSKKIA